MNLGLCNLFMKSGRVKHDFSGCTSADILNTFDIWSLVRINLDGANLRGAELRSSMKWASLNKADLAFANLSSAKLLQAELKGAKLRKAKLSDADLRGANFENADLRDSTLCGADLDGTILAGANLHGADLWNVENFTVEQLASAMVSTSTRLPKGVTLRDLSQSRQVECINPTEKVTRLTM